jgi:hypothetical protein
MKPMRLLVAVLALAALGGAIWYSDKHPPKADAPPDSTPRAQMLSIKDDQINEIHIVHPDSKAALTLDKDVRGTWTIREPKEMAADESAAKGIATSLASLGSEQVVTDKAGDWATYGLDQPKLVVQAKLADGKSVELDIGSDAPTGSPTYARVSGTGTPTGNGDKVFGITSTVKGNLDKSASDLRDKRLLRVDADRVSKVLFTNQTTTKGQPVEFTRSGNDWQFVQPRAMRAESYAVEDLIRTASAAYDSVIAEDEKDKDARKYDFSKPKITVEVVDPAGSHRLTVVQETIKGKKADKKDKKSDSGESSSDQVFYYAKTSEMPGVYKLPATASTSIEKDIKAFRRTAVFEMTFSDPDKLEMRADNTRVTIDRKQDKDKKEDQWFNGAKKLDSEKVQTFISLMRRITAKDFPSDEASEQAKYGLDKPTVDVKLTLAGKTQHVMMVGKDGKAYATREGDPSTYRIDEMEFQELQRMIGELK